MSYASRIKRVCPALLTSLWLSSLPALAGGERAAMLLPGGINDQSWNQDGYAGLMKINRHSSRAFRSIQAVAAS